MKLLEALKEIKNVARLKVLSIDEEERILLYILCARIIALLVILFNFSNITGSIYVMCILTAVTVLEVVWYDKQRIVNTINFGLFILIDINLFIAYFTRELPISEVLNAVSLVVILIYFIVNTYYSMRYIWRKMYVK